MTKTIVRLSKSNREGKKWMVEIEKPNSLKTKTVHFGASGMSDFTIHKDWNRWENYKKRHRANENWTKFGIETAGFWSRWILWNLPSLSESIKDTERRFNIKIIKKKE